jgi:hypothetical protein
MAALAPHEDAPVPFSPLILADRLLDLANKADRAGYPIAAVRLVRLAYAVCDETPDDSA